jgi:hypothetical protein
MIGAAFTGGMGAGKTSLANIVAQDYGLLKTSLAYSLKIIAAQYLGIESKAQKNARRAYQYIGHGFRHFSPTCWVTETLGRIEQHPTGGVVDDMRYANEAEIFDDAGFVLFYVKTPVSQRIRRISLRDHGCEPSLWFAMRTLVQMCHPGELNVWFAVREARRRGNLVVLDGRKPLTELQEQVRAKLNSIWRA